MKDIVEQSRAFTRYGRSLNYIEKEKTSLFEKNQ